jgi:hypothetical protein
MPLPFEPELEDPEQWSEAEKARIRLDQQFYGVTEDEDLNGLNLLDDETEEPGRRYRTGTVPSSIRRKMRAKALGNAASVRSAAPIQR